ncbi:uncharacterized protein LOC131613519 [Vicia villosa]|uniref:uncharacterized protein LOC131613519 n=1 Tax=Vicia villosa TaxID=3911 RepID=UPI00273A75EA|nr:uncharacterized protein LOC131613519 [Vicia villosa]
MAPPQYIINAHIFGETYDNEEVGFLFRNTEVKRFCLSRKANFSYFKGRLETKLAMGGVSQIFYQYQFLRGDNPVKFIQVEIKDDEDMQNMFANHEYSGYECIELYVTLPEVQPTQMVESQVIDALGDEQAEVDVVDEEEEAPEIEVDDLVNEECEDEPEVVVPRDQVHMPPVHMRNLNFDGDDEPSTDIFYDPYTQTDQRLKVGDRFRSKEACIMAIKRFHMANNVDFRVDRANVERYKIYCSNTDCGFRLHASYRKRSDSWVIGYISQDHTCVNTNVSQDHRKLSYDIICQEILPLVEKDPSLKVKTIISHIVATYNYTPSYRKAWLAKTKAIEVVYGNWEDSYKRLPHFLYALQMYAPGTVTILETLPAQSPDGTSLQGNVIFHRLFWAFRPCVQGFSYCKPILQIDGTWLYGKYKGTMLMVVAQDGNSNIFPVAFALVEGETAGGWGFFLRNLRTHVAPQPGLCLISDRHAAIESAALRKTLVNAGYALTQPTFHYYRQEIVAANPDAGRWVDSLAREKWTRSYDNGKRWGHMTTNLVESMNGVFKGIRHLPITALVEATYYRMASLFAKRGAEKWSFGVSGTR